MAFDQLVSTTKTTFMQLKLLPLDGEALDMVIDNNQYNTIILILGPRNNNNNKYVLGEKSSDHLLKVNLDVIDNPQCNKLYEPESKSKTLNRGIIDSMLCAGVLAGGKDTCLVSEIMH